MIVNVGKKELGDLLIAEYKFNYIDIGDGGDDTSTSQSTLDHSVLTGGTTIDDGSYKKLVSPTRIGNILVYEVEFTGAELESNVISEIGIFNKAGVMLNRVNFNTIGPLAANETVGFTLRLEVA